MSRWRVSDVMTADVAAIAEDASFREIVDLIEERGVSGLPVVDSARRVVGVVSEADLLPKIEFAGSGKGHTLFEGHRRRVALDKATGTVAREVMTAPAVTVPPGTPVVTAARLMDGTGIKRLPVVDDLGRLVGIVTGHDLVKVFLRPDEALLADVKTDLAALFGTVTPTVFVRVAEGIVTLSGEVDRRSLVPVLVHLAERVDGVAEVVSLLTYRYDDEPTVVNIP